jgi:hypothetical protein
MQISSSDNPREGQWMRRREDKLFGNDSCIKKRHSLVGLKISNCWGKNLTLGDQKIIKTTVRLFRTVRLFEAYR